MKKTLSNITFALLLSTQAYAAELNVAYDSDVNTLDPFQASAGPEFRMASLLFEPLVRYDKSLNFAPALAKSWEKIDDKTTRFHLETNVTFHSGNKMTAEDVLFSFERIRNAPDFKNIYSPYRKMVKIDDYTVDIIAKYPYPLVLQNMTLLFVMDKDFYKGIDENNRPKDFLTSNGSSFASTHVSGTSAFKLVSREPKKNTVLNKFSNYWSDSGNVDKITITPMSDGKQRVEGLLSGQFDLISPVDPSDINAIKESNNHSFNSVASDLIIMFQLNEKTVPQFADPLVRQAINYAIDNKSIVNNIMEGFATPASQNSPKGYLGHNERLALRYDLNKAKKLMAKAGYKDGFSVDMVAPNNRYVNDEQIAQAVVDMLAKINIKVNLTSMPVSEYWGEFSKCSAGMLMLGWASDTGDSANYSEFITATNNKQTGKGAYNCNGFSNKNLDNTIELSNQISDDKQRSRLLLMIANIEYNEAVFAPIHWQNFIWGYNNKLNNFDDIITMSPAPNYTRLKISEADK